MDWKLKLYHQFEFVVNKISIKIIILKYDAIRDKGKQEQDVRHLITTLKVIKLFFRIIIKWREVDIVIYNFVYREGIYP